MGNAILSSTLVLLVALIPGPENIEAPPPLSRAELVTTDGSSILYAYDGDDNVAAEIAISADGLQAAFGDLSLDAVFAPDGTLTVQCGGDPCSDADLQSAQAMLGAVAELVVHAPPEAFNFRCALHIVAGSAACAGSYGALCLIEFYLAACECLGSVVINGKDICDEIL